jgi:hypothetical protein
LTRRCRVGKRADGLVQRAKERLAVFPPVQRLLSARTFAGRPGKVGGHLDQRDLIATPQARRVAVDDERGNPSTFFDQRHTDEGFGSIREELRTIRRREPRVGVDIGDDDRLTAEAFVGDGLAELRQVSATGERRDRPSVRLADDEFVALDLCVIDAARLEMLANQPHRGLLNLDRIPKRAQPLVQRNQKLPLGGHCVERHSSAFVAAPAQLSL